MGGLINVFIEGLGIFGSLYGIIFSIAMVLTLGEKAVFKLWDQFETKKGK